MGPHHNLFLNVTGAGYCGHRVSYHLHLHVDPLNHPAVPGIKGYINKKGLIHCAFVHLTSTFYTQLLKLNF